MNGKTFLGIFGLVVEFVFSPLILIFLICKVVLGALIEIMKKIFAEIKDIADKFNFSYGISGGFMAMAIIFSFCIIPVEAITIVFSLSYATNSIIYQTIALMGFSFGFYRTSF